MALAPRLRAPFPLLMAAILAALLALGLAHIAAIPAADRGEAAQILALLLRSALWLGLALAAFERPILPPPLPRRVLVLAVGVGLSTGAIAGLLAGVLAPRLPAEAPLLPDPALLEAPWLVALAVAAVLLAPVAEEWLFRGAVLDGLRRGHGDGVALMGSATAFALLHPSPLHFLTALLAGLLLGWLRLRTGRVWPCALAHALHNALWFSGGLL